MILNLLVFARVHTPLHTCTLIPTEPFLIPSNLLSLPGPLVPILSSTLYSPFWLFSRHLLMVEFLTILLCLLNASVQMVFPVDFGLRYETINILSRKNFLK